MKETGIYARAAKIDIAMFKIGGKGEKGWFDKNLKMNKKKEADTVVSIYKIKGLLFLAMGLETCSFAILILEKIVAKKISAVCAKNAGGELRRGQLRLQGTTNAPLNLVSVDDDISDD